jgi:hypothetical protein
LLRFPHSLPSFLPKFTILKCPPPFPNFFLSKVLNSVLSSVRPSFLLLLRHWLDFSYLFLYWHVFFLLLQHFYAEWIFATVIFVLAKFPSYASVDA